MQRCMGGSLEKCGEMSDESEAERGTNSIGLCGTYLSVLESNFCVILQDGNVIKWTQAKMEEFYISVCFVGEVRDGILNKIKCLKMKNGVFIMWIDTAKHSRHSYQRIESIKI